MGLEPCAALPRERGGRLPGGALRRGAPLSGARLRPAILVTGVAFGLAHGLVLGLPVLSIFGITLGWLRWQTGSVYPGMVVHALFNAAALAAAVST